MKRQSWSYSVVLLIPFAFGVYGYSLVFDKNILGAIYSSIRLYGLSVDVPESDINIYIQIARWLAFLATTSVVVLLARKLFEEITIRWKLRNPETIVVHGNGAKKENVLNAMGKHGIRMSSKTCLAARTHILAFDTDAAAIKYLHEKQGDLRPGKEKEVYFISNDYISSDYEQPGLIVVNTPYNCARIYWRNHWLKNGDLSRVAIIGTGKYAQYILLQGLLVNVFAMRKPIEYHVFGIEKEAFLKWHPFLGKNIAIDQIDEHVDSIFFHHELSTTGVEALNGMERIILVFDEVDENMLCLNRLLFAGVSGEIHVRCNKNLLGHLQFIPERQRELTDVRIITFGDDATLFSKEIILHNELNQRAKTIHLSYVRSSQAANIRAKYKSCSGCKQNGLCVNCLRASQTWDDLTPFEKASNIAAADHEPIKQYMLKHINNNILSPAKYELCKAEHERWRRFYYMHNWQYGKTRNDKMRVHPSLLPFEQLEQSEQEKDWWSYEMLLQEMK